MSFRTFFTSSTTFRSIIPDVAGVPNPNRAGLTCERAAKRMFSQASVSAARSAQIELPRKCGFARGRNIHRISHF
jgi:hypothetical protein